MGRKSVVVFVLFIMGLGTFHLLVSPLSRTTQHLNELLVQWSEKQDAIAQTPTLYHMEDQADFNQSISPPEPPYIVKVTMLYGEPNEVYERALQSHIEHGQLHNYPVKVLRQKMLGRLWTKPAYLLSIVLDEFTKPPDERIEWIFWFDADTFIANPEIPLEVFIPERPELDQIHFLCGNDHNGLNDGAFLLRVNDFALHMLAAALSVETYRPQVDLKFSEQSAIEHVLLAGDTYRPWDGTRYIDGYAKIPQRWMNAYMGARDASGMPEKNKKHHSNSIQEGGKFSVPSNLYWIGLNLCGIDLLLHFAGGGVTKRKRMQEFMDSWDANKSMWRKPLNQTNLIDEVEAFWSNFSLPEARKLNESRSRN